MHGTLVEVKLDFGVSRSAVPVPKRVNFFSWLQAVSDIMVWHRWYHISMSWAWWKQLQFPKLSALKVHSLTRCYFFSNHCNACLVTAKNHSVGISYSCLSLSPNIVCAFCASQTNFQIHISSTLFSYQFKKERQSWCCHQYNYGVASFLSQSKYM